MRAGVLKTVNQVSFMTVADPVLQPGDMLLKVRAATICGTDIRILRGKKTAGVRYPSILGHEFSGEIVDTGGHRAFTAGQRVGVCPQIACGHCPYCLRGAENLCSNLAAFGYEIDGAFADYVRIPACGVLAGNVFTLPDDLSFEAAALAEPLACVMNGQDLAGVRMGDSIVILGAGPIGLIHVKLARHSGARCIIISEPNAIRREAALAAGADLAVDPAVDDLSATVSGQTAGLGADVAICAVGVPSLANDAISIVRKRSRVSLFAGFPREALAGLDVNAIRYGELTVTGAFGLTRLQFDNALKLIAAGNLRLDPFITHRFGLAEIETALQVAEQGSAIKVAII